MSYTRLFILLCCVSIASSAAVIDNLASGKKPAINTDQQMQNSILSVDNLDVVQEAFNESAATENIKLCHQSDEAICKLRIRERMPAVINFDEKILSWVLGDSKNFAFDPIEQTNTIFSLKGIYPGADTNLTVVGESGLIYSFYIRIDSIKSRYLSDFVVRVRTNPLLLDRLLLTKQKEAESQAEETNKKDVKKTKPPKDFLDKKPQTEATDFNFDFEIYHGDSALMPKRIFDDGHWTYFQYGVQKDLTEVSNLPVVYAVRDGYDTPINSRIEGSYLIVETISDKWTIRSGEKYACVRQF